LKKKNRERPTLFPNPSILPYDDVSHPARLQGEGEFMAFLANIFNDNKQIL